MNTVFHWFHLLYYHKSANLKKARVTGRKTAVESNFKEKHLTKFLAEKIPCTDDWGPRLPAYATA